MSSNRFHDLQRPVSDVLAAMNPGEFTVERLPSIWDLNLEVTYVMEDLIPEAAVILLSGDSGTGKSTFALAMAGSIVHGNEFLGRRTIQREVAIVDRENPLAVQRERLDRLGIPQTPKLYVWGGWNEPAPEGPNSVALIGLARRRGVIIFDSLVAFHPGSEQDSSETRKYMDGFRSLASLGATVIVIHHSGKSEGSREYRGSSDIKASVDTAFHLKSTDPSSISSLLLTPFKQRMGNASPMRIDYRDGVFSQSGQTNREIVESIIRLKPGSKQGDIISAAMAQGVTKHRAESLLTEGQEKGWIDVQLGQKNAKQYYLRESSLKSCFPDPPS